MVSVSNSTKHLIACTLAIILLIATISGDLFDQEITDRWGKEAKINIELSPDLTDRDDKLMLFTIQSLFGLPVVVAARQLGVQELYTSLYRQIRRLYILYYNIKAHIKLLMTGN